MADCWDCGAERARAAFCPQCEKVQPVVPNTSFYVVLDLPESMRLKRAALEKAYLDLSRRVHPDRFGRTSTLERKLALEQTTVVNDAYRTLKSPRKRAEYLMGRRGRKIGGEQERIDDLEFLAEMMELRETLSDASSVDDIEPLHDDVQGRYDKILLQLERHFDDGEGEQDEAVAKLNTLRFLERFLEEVDNKFDL